MRCRNLSIKHRVYVVIAAALRRFDLPRAARDIIGWWIGQQFGKANPGRP